MNSWRNLLIHGDCTDAIDHVTETLREQVRLIYMDPPFFSNTDYTIKRKGQSSDRHASMVTDEHSYSDRWEGGLEEYLRFMKDRLEKCKSLLSNNGSVWIHLDYHVSHYVKVMLDAIYGYHNFVNEIIWKRTNSPKVQSRGFGSQHDVILLYAKDSSSFELNPVYRPIDRKAMKPYSYQDEKGRFRLIEIEAQVIQKTQGRRRFEWKGRDAPYLYSRKKLDEWWDQGLIYTSKNGRYSKKQYLKDVRGIPVSDLWFDIPPIQGSSKEYAGFITQKPVTLLDRVIKAASSKGDIVADFFGGSGTLAVAAHQANRRWILCDISDTAIGMTQQRLAEIGCDSYELLRL